MARHDPYGKQRPGISPELARLVFVVILVVLVALALALIF
jgi:hypothetical protein